MRTVIFAVFVIGYFALEIVVASRNAYRMEPEFIFGEFVAASQAVTLCGTLKPAEAGRFDANFSYAKRRAIDAAGQARTTESTAAIEAFVRSQEADGRREVDGLVDRLGCEDIEVFKLRKRYENFARLNLPTQESDWSAQRESTPHDGLPPVDEIQ